MGHMRNIDEMKVEVRKMAARASSSAGQDIESVLANLTSKDPELWAAQGSRVAKRYEKAGAIYENAGRFEQARLSASLCILMRPADLPNGG